MMSGTSSKQSILLLGAGRMARAIVYDLHTDYDLTIADFNPKNLKWFYDRYSVQTIPIDITNKEHLQATVKPFDLIIGAVPGQYGFEMLRTVLESGKSIVDISFAPENALELDSIAKQNNATALVDFGVAPGLSNLILGHESTQMKIDKFVCQVGGLPVERKWPFEYKAPFSPIDVIEEYTRPARIRRNGKDLVIPALSEPEIINIPGIGDLESFITDGLRSILQTSSIPNMEEKTIRYPGHCELMKVYRETGLFSKELIEVNDTQVSPLDVTAELLLPKWKLKEGETEFTAMILDFGNSEMIKRYTLIDHFDPETGLTSMARTTGLSCATGARMILEGIFSEKGVFPPEHIGKNNECYTFTLNKLSSFNIEFSVINL